MPHSDKKRANKFLLMNKIDTYILLTAGHVYLVVNLFNIEKTKLRKFAEYQFIIFLNPFMTIKDYFQQNDDCLNFFIG